MTQAEISVTTRVCRKCKRELPESAFDGPQFVHCQDCVQVICEFTPNQVRRVKILAVPLIVAVLNIALWLWLDLLSPGWVILLTAIVTGLWIAYNYDKFSIERNG